MPESRKYILAATGCVALVIFLASVNALSSPPDPDAETLGSQIDQLERAGKYAEAIPIATKLLEMCKTTMGAEHPATAVMLDKLARLHSEAGEYKQAEALYLDALQIYEKTLGPDDVHTAATTNNLAEVYRYMGAYAKAAALYERVLEIDRKAGKIDDRGKTATLNNLALVYTATGNYTKAESIYAHILEVSEKTAGPQDPETAAVCNNFAKLYETKGDYTKAEPLYLRALKIDEKALGAEHPSVAAILNGLVVLYAQTGNLAKAEALSKRALIIREKALGPEHPDTAASITNLAVLYFQMGAYAKAEPLYLRALQIHEKVFGPDSPLTDSILSNLALIYERKGEYKRAEQLLQRVLNSREKALGPEHPDTALSLSNLAALYNEMGEYASAQVLLERALRIDEKAFGGSHPEAITSLNNLAFLFLQKGDYVKAASLFQRTLATSEKVLGPEHPTTADCLNNLALLYDDIGDYARAESLHQEALRIREKALGPEHPATAQSLGNLAGLYRVVGDYVKAVQLYQRALEIQEKALGPEHPDTAQTLTNLAVVWADSGNDAKAEPLYQRALKIRENTLGPEHPDIVNSLNNLASVYQRTHKYTEAESLLKRALEISEKALGSEHPTTAICLGNLAMLYHTLGDYSKAEPLDTRALEIREKALGPEHPDTAHSLNNLAWLELDVSKTGEARSLALRFETAQLKVLSNILSYCSEQQRLTYQDTIDPYALFAALERSDHELATVSLRYKGVVLDSIIEDRVLAEASQNKQDREMIQTLSIDKQRLGQLLLGPAKTTIDQTNKEIQRLEEKIEQIESGLARHVARVGGARRALSVTVEEVQAAIPADGVLVEYLLYQHYLGKGKFEPHYGAIVLTALGEPHWIPIGRAVEIEKSVKRYRNQVADGQTTEQTIEETLRELCDQVWAPVEQVLPNKTRTVIISPDAQLNFISFATLLTSKDRFLAEDHIIRYVSSGRDLLRDIKLATNSRLIAFGNPDFELKAVPIKKSEPPIGQQIALRGQTREALEDLELPPLPGTKAECTMLAERSKQWKWPSSRFLAAAATEAELRKVRSPFILHLATHGFFLDAQKEDHPELELSSQFETKKSRYFENPMHRAGLALAGAQTTLDAWRRGDAPPTENDGIVTAEEVGALKLEGTWLVTLSACNTGTGEAKSGEGVLGLRRGFIQAGAKNLLMTLWPISDETTVDIMADFYEAAHQSGNAPQALAKVQRDWLVKLRKSRGLLKAVNLAGPFILSSQGKP